MKKALVFALFLLSNLALWAQAGVVPRGSEISVRTNETIDSRTTHAGQTFSAVVEQDITDDSGRVAIPRGSDAQVVLRKVSGGGALGSGEMTLDLHSVTVGGRRYMVGTSDIEKSNKRGIGKNRRTAKMVGGGAVLGTLIGAVAGGGKGAAIGAMAGAAAGGTAQVLTKGRQVRVPAETVLKFRLDQSLQIDSR